MPFFGLRGAKKTAAEPPQETDEERRAREAEEERLRLQEESRIGTSYTKKGMPRRKKMLDEAGEY